jgi:beta-N-acetylhexosaminidase
MGMTKSIKDLCEQAIRERVFPGCVVGYIRDGETNVLPFGRWRYEAGSPPVQVDSIYDVASLTKAIPTSSIALKLIEDGKLSLDDVVIKYVPELQNEYRNQITVRHLLTYTVVFNTPPGIAKIAIEQPNEVLPRLFAAELMSPPGTKYVYSSGPTILLGLIIERIFRQPLDEIAQKLFFGPLGMEDTSFYPERMDDERIVPTEVDWRGEVRGQAHDEAVWALRKQGRIPGHAGLFSTAGDLLKFAEMLLNEGAAGDQRLLKAETIPLMHTNQLKGLNAETALGWKIDLENMTGGAGSPSQFGMTGFTGCLIVVDPERKAAMVHLSNRLYPKRPESREPIEAFWRSLADLVLG